MNLFCKPYISKASTIPLEEILKELSLFKQTKYCFEYIKKQCPGKSDEDANEQAEIAAASFRQAFEFYNSAKSNYISTSPLLYSYSLNNFAKGLIYLSNSELSKYFKRHGFTVEDKNLKNNLLDTLITVDQQGPATALLILLGNHNIEKQSLSFKDLLEHIPEISDIYFKSTQKASSVAFLTSYGNYNLKSKNWDEDLIEKKELLEYFRLCGSYIGRIREFSFYITMAGGKILNDTNSRRNFFYKDSVILPIKLEEGIYSINLMYYAYLIIMSYGMIVRYNASKWEKYIDPKLSNESTLINESLIECVKIFIQHVHIILFGYSYDYPKYNDENVKQVIKDSTKDIMKNIREEILSENRISGKKIYLPW